MTREAHSGLPQKLVLYSQYARYPMHWQAFEYLCLNYRVDGTVIQGPTPRIPSVHEQLGQADLPTLARDRPLQVRVMPKRNRALQASWLAGQLRSVRPDAIWIQEEPTDRFLLEILALYRLRPKPWIVAAVCENIFPAGAPAARFIRRVLWSRLNGLLAVAQLSIRGVRAAGMPDRIPASTLVAGGITPPQSVEPLPLPFSRGPNDFVVAFAGRICEEKGWKVLLDALAQLPETVHCMLAGDGDQLAQLEQRASASALAGRVHYVGLLDKARLWRFYAASDCLVVPSLDTPGWKEQFGGVLADAMAMGLPIIGSDGGAIPEVVGPAGVIVPQGRPDLLAKAIGRLRADNQLRARLGGEGCRRFDREFAIPAYATKIAAALHLTPR
jgi:glycosyltransferase involved in cell wall biosynthesis